jgi:hypothetical protein
VKFVLLNLLVIFKYLYAAMLTISFHKNTPKPVVLRCERTDGSTTWSRLHPGTEYHDLAHVAIEKSLGLKQSFFGLVAAGYDIPEFELPEEQKPEKLRGSFLPQEAIITEHMVNLLLVERFNDGRPENFLQQLQAILKENNIPLPNYLTESALALIRSTFNELIMQWKKLPLNEYLVTTISL